MIYITKIVGESFDLQTGEEHKSAIEISNGISSRLITVLDSAIPVIVELFAEVQSPTEKNVSVASKIAEAVQESFENQEDEVEPLPFDPEDTDWEDEEPREHLNDYEDEDTGVGSI